MNWFSKTTISNEAKNWKKKKQNENEKKFHQNMSDIVELFRTLRRENFCCKLFNCECDSPGRNEFHYSRHLIASQTIYKKQNGIANELFCQSPDNGLGIVISSINSMKNCAQYKIFIYFFSSCFVEFAASAKCFFFHLLAWIQRCVAF